MFHHLNTNQEANSSRFFDGMTILKQILRAKDYGTALHYLDELLSEVKSLTRDEMSSFLLEVKSEAEIQLGLTDVKGEGKSVFIEKTNHKPSAIFHIKTSNSQWILGRKNFSPQWLDSEISEIHCSKIFEENLLGIIDNFQVTEHEVIHFYKKFSEVERRKSFDQIINDKKTKISFPFLTRSYLPNEPWPADNIDLQKLDNGERHFRKFVINHLPFSKRESFVVYDPACSSGEFLSSIKREFSGAVTIGSDFSSSMIEIANKKLDKVFICDAINIPLEASSCDLVVARMLNLEVLPSDKAYQIALKLIDLLKPNGRLVLLGHTPVLVQPEFFEMMGLAIECCLSSDSEDRSVSQCYLFKKS